MSLLKFPKNFIWGTSTAAAQVETASEHNWKGFVAKDGYVFERTSDHEKRRSEDVAYIKKFGSIYRCGVDWARLQKAAFAPFELDVVEEYQQFFQELQDNGMQVMFVIHHFTNPLWFENNGSWENEDNIPAFVDYARKCIEHFADYVYTWNTFNEPNVYAVNGWFTGNFPPQKKSLVKALAVLKRLGKAHDIVYDILKKETPDKRVGISLNSVWFDAKNILGVLPARFNDFIFNRKSSQYFQRLDYWGLSYYAYIPMGLTPITEIDNPGELAKMGIPHDKMWGYRPEGLERIIRRIHRWYGGKDIIITENGICTDDSQKRISSIKDYLSILHKLIGEGIPIKGYIHWSTWDNFEWNLGPTYRFGLVRIDLDTMERKMTEAGDFYSKVTKENQIEV